MPRKQGRKRIRGDDGRLYNARACRDAGKRAHENRIQTWLRRRREKLNGYVGWLTSLLPGGDR